MQLEAYTKVNKKQREQEIAKAEKAIAKAMIELFSTRYPLLGDVAIRMRVRPTWLIPTTAVDAHKNMWYNPTFINECNTADVRFAIGHEAGHVIQNLFGRTPKKVIHYIWNIAADYLVNTMLVDMGFKLGPVAEKVTTKEIQDRAREAKITEVMYRWLLEELQDSECPACSAIAKMAKDGTLEDSEGAGGCGDCEDEGEECDKHKIPDHTCGNEQCCHTGSMTSERSLTNREQIEIHDKWEQIVLKAAISQKKRGNIPGALEDFIAKLGKPKVRWTDYIRIAATSVFRDRYTYYVRSRRSYAMGMILPGRTKAVKGAVGVFDTSGSMSDQEIHASLSEFVGLMEQCGCPKTEVIFHDADIYYHGDADKADLAKMKIQRGGTNHRPVFERLTDKKRREKPAIVVCFTDLCTLFPENKPSFPVIWCCPEDYKDAEIPWGLKVPVDMETLRE